MKKRKKEKKRRKIVGRNFLQSRQNRNHTRFYCSDYSITVKRKMKIKQAKIIFFVLFLKEKLENTPF